MKTLMIAAAALLIVVSPALARDRYGSYHRQRAAPNAEIWTGAYIEGGVGVTSENGDVVVPGFLSATLGDTAWSAHLGVGYDHVVVPHWLIGMLARVEWSGVSHAITLASTLRKTTTPSGWSVAASASSPGLIGWRTVGYKFADLVTPAGAGNPSRNAGSLESASKQWLPNAFL